ncbi:hypothetical protein CASFOL_027269 [Castilleja foliolosa]|uniref:Uncharacterized protein n=1 Tax=Castilleja foliolosa TaxID=1961234 RepID=A0ABD3CEB6_9LAMI
MRKRELCIAKWVTWCRIFGFSKTFNTYEEEAWVYCAFCSRSFDGFHSTEWAHSIEWSSSGRMELSLRLLLAMSPFDRMECL